MNFEASIATKFVFTSVAIFLSSFMTYIGVDSETFLLYTALLVFDYITGIAKARSLSEKISSHKMKYGIISKMLLMMIPLALAIAAKAVDADFKEVLSVCFNMLVISELYSILGNIYSFRTKKELPEYDVVAIIGRKIHKFLLRISDVRE